MGLNGVLRSAVFFGGVIYGLAGFVFSFGFSVGVGCYVGFK